MRLLNAIVVAALWVVPSIASAQPEYSPDPLEPAPEGEVPCSWSTMKKAEYEECMKKREFFSKMKPDEKEEYNKEVAERQTEARIESLERRVDMLERGRRR